MDSRFSEKSQKILRLSHEIATDMHYNYVGSEHIIAAILKDASTDVYDILSSQGIEYEAFREKIAEYTLPSLKVNPSTSLPLTPRSKIILEISFNEAKKQGSLLIEPVHMFLAILREGSSVAVRILKDLGLDFPHWRRICRVPIRQITPKETKVPKEASSKIWSSLAQI